ncbi:MAG: hypothetical protein DRI90_14760 [Deltaproteobacteria bacterium]|nr:MAG: hypothetical protein DRI90_14760 [Deltaproteobacteria bacterium]
MSNAKSDDESQTEIVLTLEPEPDEDSGGDDSDGELVGELLSAVLDVQAERESRQRTEAERRAAERIDGVELGKLVTLTDDGPKVTYPSCPTTNGLVARCAAQLTEDHVGGRVALLFEGGDPARPMVVGPIHNDQTEGESEHPAIKGLVITESESRIDIRCRKAIGINVGKATIIITPAGQIVVKGKHLLNHASAVNRIRGATVKIN